jgi:hypothetical protein
MAGGGPSCKSSKKCSWRYPHWELAKQQHQGKGFRFIWFYLPMARRVALHEMPLLLCSGSTLCRVRNDCAMLSWLKALPFGPDGSQQWTGFPDMAPRLQSQNIADICRLHDRATETSSDQSALWPSCGDPMAIRHQTRWQNFGPVASFVHLFWYGCGADPNLWTVWWQILTSSWGGQRIARPSPAQASLRLNISKRTVTINPKGHERWSEAWLNARVGNPGVPCHSLPQHRILDRWLMIVKVVMIKKKYNRLVVSFCIMLYWILLIPSSPTAARNCWLVSLICQ